jgi:tetratricopeptide (TPR) repeat protein
MGNACRSSRHHPDNRMAFDYLIAWCLLERQAFPMLPDYLGHLKEAGYTVLPTHVQEALLTYEKQIGRAVEIPGFGYDPAAKRRFSAFLEEMGRLPSRAADQSESAASLQGTFMYYHASSRLYDTGSYGTVFWRLGNQFQAMGMDEEALAHYRCAVWLSPRVAVAHLKLADLLKKQGKLEEADIQYSQARETNRSPTQPQGKPNQGAPERVE